MKLTQSKEINLNYAAKIVDIQLFSPHPNPKVERLKCCVVDGYNITVSKDTQPGLYIYFPVECCLNPKFLSANNLYRDNTKNQCPDVAGFFEESGRVKMIRLQQHPSEGLIMPVASLYHWLALENVNPPYNMPIEAGTIFDGVDNLILCKKYVPKYVRTPGQPGSRQRDKRAVKATDRLIDKQFRFHYDTIKLKNCPDVIQPGDVISITAKVHGTSGISAYVRCKEEKTRMQRLLNKVGTWLGLRVDDTKYDYLYASRKVIKSLEYNPGATAGYYGPDDIVRKCADNLIKPTLTKGLTVYYEIIGFLPSGAAIQSLGGKPYDYGCVPPTEGSYVYGTNYKVQIYRVTYTNPDGVVYEFSAKQVQQWAKSNGLEPVEEYYYGYAGDLYPDITNSGWNAKFIERLSNDKEFNMEKMSPTCISKVPHEGIVIRIENSQSMAYKLKCVKFLEQETADLDKGVIDIESGSDEG